MSSVSVVLIKFLAIAHANSIDDTKANITILKIAYHAIVLALLPSLSYFICLLSHCFLFLTRINSKHCWPIVNHATPQFQIGNIQKQRKQRRNTTKKKTVLNVLVSKDCGNCIDKSVQVKSAMEIIMRISSFSVIHWIFFYFRTNFRPLLMLSQLSCLSLSRQWVYVLCFKLSSAMLWCCLYIWWCNTYHLCV